MIDRHYFEELLPEQVRGFSLPVSVQITTENGRTYDAHRLLAAHEAYAVFETYPEYGADFMGRQAGQQPVLMGQVVLPYSQIAAVHLTGRTETSSPNRPVGYQVAAGGGKKSR